LRRWTPRFLRQFTSSPYIDVTLRTVPQPMLDRRARSSAAMSVGTTEQGRSGLAEQASERRPTGGASAQDLNSGDVVVWLAPASGCPAVVPAREPDADAGPGRLAAMAVIVPILTAFMITAWLLLR
jgi:hypothetical protein